MDRPVMDRDRARRLRPFSPEHRPVWGLAVRWATVLVGLVVALTVIALALRWFGAADGAVSPENVAAQYRQAYTDFEALKATAGNVCAARAVLAAESDPELRAQRSTQVAAYEQNYRRIAAGYDAAYDDVFRARHVGPPDLPAEAPGLDAALAAAGCGKLNNR